MVVFQEAWINHKRSSLAVALVVAAISPISRADDQGANETVRVWDDVLAFVRPNGGDASMRVGDRRRFAEAIRSYCRYYRDLIPTLSPSEQEWLNRELGIGSSPEGGGRPIAALKLVEQSQAALTSVYDGCVAVAEHFGRIGREFSVRAPLVRPRLPPHLPRPVARPYKRQAEIRQHHGAGD